MDQEERDQISASQFVTYKWLIGTALSLMIITIALMGILANNFSATMQNKVNMELYATQHQALCVDIDEIKKVVDGNQKSMVQLNANQILVLRALKIDPVK